MAIGASVSSSQEPPVSLQRYRSVSSEERISMLESLREASPTLRSRTVTGDADPDLRAAPGGGASLANYDDLIRLIESTIDGDWLINGGTSTIVPYRNGVRISTEGLIERIGPVEHDAAIAKAKRIGRMRWDALGDWQKPSDLRWVSLHEVDRLVDTLRKNGRLGKLELELLGGIVRIDYLAWDSDSNEWLIGGPAGNLVPNVDGELVHEQLRLPPVLLEDLITIAPHVLSGGGEFGCSIDPDTKRLQQAYEYAMQPGAQRSLQRTPDRWIENWRKLLGEQNTTIVGLPADSPTAFALLKADVEMKMMGLGLEPVPPTLRSYWHETEFLQSRSPNGLVRWWYTLHTNKIPYDSQQAVYKISVQNVKVLSESQFINEQGDRVVSNLPDIAADAFATQFTKQHEEIQRHSIVQARLRHILDLAVVMELIRNEMMKERGAPFQCLHDLTIQPRMPRTPHRIQSIASTHQAKDGTRYAVVSGGVAIKTLGLTRRLSLGSNLKTVTVEPTSDSKSQFWKEDIGSNR